MAPTSIDIIAQYLKYNNNYKVFIFTMYYDILCLMLLEYLYYKFFAILQTSLKLILHYFCFFCIWNCTNLIKSYLIICDLQ